MRAFKVIKSPEAFQLIGDETRRRIIYLLRAKDMTVSQIADELDKTPQAIYHHIAKLKDAGMIEVAKEERVAHFIETYYRTTAEVFQFAYGEGQGARAHAEKEAQEALETLPRIGFKAEWDEATVRKLVDLQLKMEELGRDSKIEEKVVALDNIGFLTQQTVAKFAKWATMSDKDWEAYVRLIREMRETLKSTVSPKIRA